MNDDISINDIIDKDGKKKYAYVVMVIKNNIYAIGSIIFADSIRKNGSIGSLIVMIDNSIENEIVDILKNFFDQIILIDIIDLKNDNSIQQIILTKLNIFKLTQYDKIFLIDVDTILFNNIDNLFLKSATPSINIINGKLNYGIILIKPSMKLYLKSIKIIEKYNKKLEQEKRPFEFVINKLFKKLNKLDLKISRDKFENIDGIQYIDEKPFLMSSNISIEQRIRLNHFKIWFSYFLKIINKYYYLKKKIFLQECISVSKYFLESISRFIPKNIKIENNKKKKQVYLIYNKKKYENICYFHLDISKEYINDTIYISKINHNLLNIDYFLNYLKNTTGINYDKYINKSILSFKMLKNKIDIQHMDIIINNYIKIFENVFMVIKIGNFKIKTSDELIDLENNIIYSKKLIINGLCLKNIMFNICQNFTYDQKIIFLSQLINDYNYEVVINVYTTITQITSIDYIKNYDLFVLFNLTSKNRANSIFFNSNTLKMFELKHDLCNYFENNLTRDNLIKIIYFQTIKKWIFNNYSNSKLSNIILKYLNHEKYIIYDNNDYNVEDINNINANKIYFISIVFMKYSKHENFIFNLNQIINMMYNPLTYWELEGIKLIL